MNTTDQNEHAPTPRTRCEVEMPAVKPPGSAQAPTPRTESEFERIAASLNAGHFSFSEGLDQARRFARALERELAQAQKDLAGTMQAGGYEYFSGQRAEAERRVMARGAVAVEWRNRATRAEAALGEYTLAATETERNLRQQLARAEAELAKYAPDPKIEAMLQESDLRMSEVTPEERKRLQAYAVSIINDAVAKELERVREDNAALRAALELELKENMKLGQNTDRSEFAFFATKQEARIRAALAKEATT